MNNAGIVVLIFAVFIIYMAATGRLVRVVSIVTGKTITVPNMTTTTIAPSSTTGGVRTA